MGWLRDCVDRVKFYADDPSVGAKYTDAEIIKHFVEPAWSQVFNAMAMTQDNCVTCRHTFTTVADQPFYTLPPHMRRILKLTQFDIHGNTTHDYLSRSEYNARGPGWLLNGNQLEIRPWPENAVELDIFYIPTADIRLHEATGGRLVDVSSSPSTTKLTLDSTPTLGTVDNRSNAYAGCYIEINNGASTDQVFTYIVESYDASTRQVTVRGTLDSTITDIGLETDVEYAIVTPLGSAMSQVIALRAVMTVLTVKRASQASLANMRAEFVSALKDVRDTFTNLNARMPKRFERDVAESTDMPWQPLFGTFGV